MTITPLVNNRNKAPWESAVRYAETVLRSPISRDADLGYESESEGEDFSAEPSFQFRKHRAR